MSSFYSLALEQRPSDPFIDTDWTSGGGHPIIWMLSVISIRQKSYEIAKVDDAVRIVDSSGVRIICTLSISVMQWLYT
jgi:ABC-type polysaccharide transport system permease subunit